MKNSIDFFVSLCFIKRVIEPFECIDLQWVGIRVSICTCPTFSNVKAYAAENQLMEDEGVRGHAVGFDLSKRKFLVSKEQISIDNHVK